MRRSTRLLPVAFFMVTAWVIAPSTAIAEEVGTSERHCVVRLIESDEGSQGGYTAATLQDEGCYDTLEQALSVGTGTSVDLADDTAPADLTDASLSNAVTAQSVSMAGNVLIGIEYNDWLYDGWSTSYYASAGCNVSNWGVSYVGNGENDRYESGKGFNGCKRNRKFEHSNFGGESVLCQANCADYGYLRNRVSSLRWRS